MTDVIRKAKADMTSPLFFSRGDIIKAVNGYRLDSVEKAMELWKILKNENHVKIELERAGKDFILDIEIS